MFRLAFCDLDGTLLKTDHTVSPVVAQTLQAVIDAGKFITICSGRSYPQFSEWLAVLPVNAPVVTCNGGVIVELATRKVLFENPIPADVMKDVALFAEEEHVNARISLSDVRTLLDYRAEEGRFVLSRDGELVTGIDDPLSVLDQPAHKCILLHGGPDANQRSIERLTVRLGGRARVVASSERWAEVVAPGVSKAVGMAWLCRYLGVAQGETLAIGDADNDIEMLEWAGCGVAMGNAMPAARAAASWVAPHVNDDGAAVALRRFMLNGVLD